MLKPSHIESRIRKLLEQLGVSEPPVIVEEIAKQHNVEIRYEPYDGDVSGALYRNGNVKIIGVNKLDGRVRQRFTIAHEIGHLVLHDDPVHIDHHYPIELPKTLLRNRVQHFRRDSISRLAINPQEMEANAFAASLLMPMEFLSKDLRKLQLPLKDDDIIKLTTKYDVSQQAMVFRLLNIGVSVENA